MSTRAAFLFSGQRSLAGDFLARLARSREPLLRRLASPEARARVARAFEVFSDSSGALSAEQSKTENVQMAVFLSDLVAFEALADSPSLRAALPSPAQKVFFGNSLGEVSALVASGFFGFEDGVRLVSLRARLLQAHFDRLGAAPDDQAQPSGMALVKLRRASAGPDPDPFWPDLERRFRVDLSASLSPADKIYSGPLAELREVG